MLAKFRFYYSWYEATIYYLLIQATILKKYTIIQKFKVCKFVWKKLILLFSKDAFTLIKSDSKDIYVECYTKFCLKKRCCITVNVVASRFLQKCEATTIFNVDNNQKCFLHIRMISEGSCDTEDWSNDVENSALHHRNKLYFKIYSHRKQLF